jgi:hypothetical protein
MLKLECIRLSCSKNKKGLAAAFSERDREALSTGSLNPIRYVFWLSDRPVYRAFPARVCPVTSGILQQPSPITAAGPPRIHTGFRFIESERIIRLAGKARNHLKCRP